MFKYGNPLILEGSGRIKTDPLNENRIELVLGRFEEWARGQGQLDRFNYTVNKEQSTRSLIAFPAAGFAVLFLLDSLARLPHSPSCIPTQDTLESSSRCSQLGWDTRFTSNTMNRITTHAELAISGTIPTISDE
jgi:hypothetical protein